MAVRRAGLDPTTERTLDTEGDLSVVHLVTAQGSKLSIGIDPDDDLPYFVRWAQPQDNMGQLSYTVYFTGYAPFDGILLPMGYNTVIDWRDIDYMKIYVDNVLATGSAGAITGTMLNALAVTIGDEALGVEPILGKIKDFKFWDVVLALADVQQLTRDAKQRWGLGGAIDGDDL